MKRLLCSLVLLLGSLSLFAQESYTYLFSSTPFTSSPAGGPTLEAVGTTTTPVNVVIPSTTCPDTPSVDLTHFEMGSGFKAQAFFTETYSIEVIFQFDDLSGYQRIIDFSNSLSDNGIYTYGDCLNFYPTGNIGPCPGAFDLVNYKQLVLTRDGATDTMKVYFNGSLFTTFHDGANHYTISSAPNDSIKFFLDDIVVAGEEQAGNVALIRLADFVFSPAAVTTSFNDFCTRITGMEGPVEANEIAIYPNPATGNFTIESTGIINSIEIYDMLGKRVFAQSNIHQRSIALDPAISSKGIYLVHIYCGDKTYTREIVIQ